MRNWLRLYDQPLDELARLVSLARQLKAGQASKQAKVLHSKLLGMMFFNPSLRTRVSFEAAMKRFGGDVVSLNVGLESWKLEYKDGVLMDGDRAEHMREAAPVLSRYCDALAVRTFARLADPIEDAADEVLNAFARFATVGVISMESAIEHPCQGLADRMTLEEKLGDPRGRTFVLTWAPQVKPLPMAVPHSAILAAASAGMNVVVAHPPGYQLNRPILERASEWCQSHGMELSTTNDQRTACSQAEIVYVKSWGSVEFYGDLDKQRESFRAHADWMVTPGHLGPETKLMHCLPVRRNVVIADAALDDPRSIVVDQAENRLWAQASILISLLSER